MAKQHKNQFGKGQMINTMRTTVPMISLFPMNQEVCTQASVRPFLKVRFTNKPGPNCIERRFEGVFKYRGQWRSARKLPEKDSV